MILRASLIKLTTWKATSLELLAYLFTFMFLVISLEIDESIS